MKLYEIDAEIEQCILIDEETGEVIGIDTERADKLQMLSLIHISEPTRP